MGSNYTKEEKKEFNNYKKIMDKAFSETKSYNAFREAKENLDQSLMQKTK